MDIEVKNLTKTYGAQQAVAGITFHLRKGQIVGFLGPNGAGKTTTMKAICCYLAPTSGEITVGGHSTRTEPDKVKSLIGYLPESNPLYTDMCVIDYLKFVARLQRVPEAKVRERVARMVELCGLEAEKHKAISELSKGYKQRVGLAQAMIHDPEVLILDEPTTGLDPNQIIEIRELIKRLGREKTVVLSSHILAEVEATCDRILILSRGKIVADGTYAELSRQASPAELLEVGVGGAPVDDAYEALRALPGVEMVDIRDAAGCQFEVRAQAGRPQAKAVFDMCAARGWHLTRLTPVETSLEEIFRELTAN